MFSTSANTFLGACSPVIGALIKTQKYVFKLIHACISKEQSRVITRYYGARRNDLVAFFGKEIQVSLANLGDFHTDNYRTRNRLGQTLVDKL